MNRAELMANAEGLIAAAGENLNGVTATIQASPGPPDIDTMFALINAQTGLAAACIDLARMK